MNLIRDSGNYWESCHRAQVYPAPVSPSGQGGRTDFTTMKRGPVTCSRFVFLKQWLWGLWDGSVGFFVLPGGETAAGAREGLQKDTPGCGMFVLF